MYDKSSSIGAVQPRSTIICAAGKVAPAGLGDGELDGESDADGDEELEALLLEDGESEAEGERDADGLLELEALGVADGLAETLLIISRTAKCTIARSSDVPEDIPTDRDPCPAVVSRTTTQQVDPISIDCTAVLLAPVVGGVA